VPFEIRAESSSVAAPFPVMVGRAKERTSRSSAWARWISATAISTLVLREIARRTASSRVMRAGAGRGWALAASGMARSSAAAAFLAIMFLRGDID